MVRSQLIRETALRTGYSQRVCDEIIREMFTVITAELEAHGSVKLSGFGTFSVYDKKPTRSRRPENGEWLEIAGKKYPRFIPADTLKNIVDN